MPDINFDNMEKGSFFKESIHILHDAYISKKLILFIGSGADHDSGLPLWDDAIKVFCKHLNISPSGVDNLKIPQLYYNSRGRMPPELRKAHQDNDRAVMAAYGFSVRDMTENKCVAELMRMYQMMTRLQD